MRGDLYGLCSADSSTAGCSAASLHARRAPVLAQAASTGGDVSKAAPKDAPKGDAKAAAPAKTYVGVESCQMCHEEIVKNFDNNPHHMLESSGKSDGAGKGRQGWSGKSCEACHGPGSAHMESLDKNDIRNPAAINPVRSAEVCLSCHLNTTAHSGRLQNSHARNEVACVTCHVMHKTRDEVVLRKPALVNAKCASCHVAVWAAFQELYHHKVPEGAMSCVDCHNPHGRTVTNTVRATAAANDPGCNQCHADKRGPFLFEHEPVRTDGCTACHVPHGSANPRMLIRNEPRVMCLECHANIGVGNAVIGSTPPAVHDLRNPRYQNCVICHIKIHGSNVNHSLLR